MAAPKSVKLDAIRLAQCPSLVIHAFNAALTELSDVPAAIFSPQVDDT